MSRRDFLKLAAALPVAAMGSQAGATPADPMARLVAELFRQRDAYELIPDPDGWARTPEHDATYAQIERIEAEIVALPITSREGVAAYCRYLAKEAELVEIDPWQFAKIIDWAAGGAA